uniref:leucine-rich repeat-containing protein 75A-like isoform X1 n=2 Tax=Myxine glutinosa TaxID=7769 RepID=UPI00358E2193
MAPMGSKAGKQARPQEETRTGMAAAIPAPYERRVALVQELQGLVRDGCAERATGVLRSLRQDLGMETTSLDDVLYRYASFRNVVDPISHDLILSLARDLHCPKREAEAVHAFEKICRQLIYHLSPHSQLHRPSIKRKKQQTSLKNAIAEVDSGTLALSGVPLMWCDIERLCAFLVRKATITGEEGGNSAEGLLTAIELSFTELNDEGLRLLLPALSALPCLAGLALNGNRLTRTVLRDLADCLKEPGRFPALEWLDVGNNVDIFSLPQPLLLGLRKRCPKQGSLPTILETAEGPLPPEQPVSQSYPLSLDKSPITTPTQQAHQESPTSESLYCNGRLRYHRPQTSEVCGLDHGAVGGSPGEETPECVDNPDIVGTTLC